MRSEHTFRRSGGRYGEVEVRDQRDCGLDHLADRGRSGPGLSQFVRSSRGQRARGEADFRACLDAYYASVGGAPGIDWVRIALVLLAGLAVIWILVFAIKAMRSDKAEP